LVDEPVRPVTVSDLDMVGPECADIKRMGDIHLYPRILKNNFNKIIKSETILYLGAERV
jgi:hypothetical protein